MPGYKATISSSSEDMKSDLGDLRSILARTNWYLKALGLPPEQQKALQEMMQFIATIRTLQMILAATSVVGVATSALRLAGMGSSAKVLKDLSKVARSVS